MTEFLVSIKRALLSVSDKTHLKDLAQTLSDFQVELISTGGTKKFLEEAGFRVTPIEQVTGNPEAFGGRMKTISFQVGSALLYRRGVAQDESDAGSLGIRPLDLVVCNLYPFAQALQSGAEEEELIENIDIGGPTMVRAAAKNFASVTICTDPKLYGTLISELKEHQGATSLGLRKKLAARAFALTAQYDGMIANNLMERFLSEEEQKEHFITLSKRSVLRYGENAHQQAVFYEWGGAVGVGNAPVLQGKALSYNNLLDADAAWKCLSDVKSVAVDLSFSHQKAVVIVKHLNPCGVALASTNQRALELAWECDPVSAFGGILAFSDTVEEAQAKWLSDKFIEIVVAPDFTPEALEIFSQKKNIRVIRLAPKKAVVGEKILRTIYGGVLLQNEDEGRDQEIRTVTKASLPQGKEGLVQFGTMVNKYLKSNAVSLVAQTPQGEFVLLGAGVGQPNRIDSLRRLAVPRARERQNFNLSEAVLISDAFFPFPDSIEACHAEGIRHVVQPGGSIKDPEVIAAADKFGISMVFTGTRHFRH